MSDGTAAAPSHLDVKLFSRFVAGLADARTLLDTTPPDVVINERESPNIPGLQINDGAEYRDVAGYAGTAYHGDFVNDFSLRWNDATLAALPAGAGDRFKPVTALSDFVATGERDLAVIVPASLAQAAEKVFELSGVRHNEERGPWDDDTYSRASISVIEHKEGSHFEPGEYVKFNLSPTAIDRFRSRFAVGVSKQEEVA